MRPLRLVLALTAAACCTLTQAKDLGVQSNVWPITEVDIRQKLLESASEADWDAARKQVEDSARTYLDRLPRRQMPSASQTATRWIDPSVTLSSDIRVPIRQPDGRYDWQVLYRAGQKVNPLATHRPSTAMLFFDGGSEEQVAFVTAVLASNPLTVVPVEATGAANPDKLGKRLGRPVFYANDQMVERFQLKRTPALLYPGTGLQSLSLGLTEFARPYDVAALERLWAPVRATQVKPNTSPANAPRR